MEMTSIKGDLSPILGSTLVRIDGTHTDLFKNENLVEAINDLGRLSAQNRHHQQDLRQKPVTSCEKLLQSVNVLYLAWEYERESNQSRLLGILRVGRKQLYLYDNCSIPYKGNFVCVLDFYVHYCVQKRGIGQRLFEFMMENERIDAAYQIAFDNPSVALLRFLSKKFGLEDPIWQNTSFVVFPELFSTAENLVSDDDPTPPEGWRRSATPRHINNGITGSVKGARFLENAISGHSAARKARLRQAENVFDMNSSLNALPFAANNRTISNERSERTNASQMQCEARQRKQHVLSSKPLW